MAEAGKNETERTLRMNNPNENYVSNTIKSTSSNLLTFIPLNLIGQLSNLANVYFILIAILQAIPAISITGGKPTTLLPLSFVMLTVLVKDAYEEYYRYVKDKSENERQVEVWKNNQWAFSSWENLRVGEVIKINKDDMIPCDALVITTSDLQYRAYLETKGLDGQTNLKVKKSFVNNMQSKRQKDQNIFRNNYQITAEKPNPFLQKFSGFIQVDREQVPLNSDNLVLRGCLLRNVRQAICVCIYTGSDTKVVLNSVKFQPKKSKLMTQVNVMVVEIFIWQILIALACALLNRLLETSYPDFMANLPLTQFFIISLTWWLMMTYFVPISLMVTMEMVKLFQGVVLQKDIVGYSKQYDCFTSANNTSVNQNLGQIKYVFTDKTGTLTKNEMVFKKFYSDGKVYGLKQDETDKYLLDRLSKVNNVSFKDSLFKKNIQSPKIQSAMRVLYLCHDIFVEKEGNKIIYNSSSPDEIALINFAKLYDKELLGEEGKYILIGENESKNIVRYQKLAFLEFNSDRKRMSTIVRNPRGEIQILSKGADDSIASILRPGDPDLKQAKQVVDDLSVEGLRTLFLGRRSISEGQYTKWNEEFRRASAALSDRQKLLDSVYNKIETNLQLVGATAIEDKLQDDVVNTIGSMRLAGMSFYILTGDKKQTAINIGRSCGLINEKAITCDIPDYDQKNAAAWKLEMLRLKEIKGDKVYLLNASKPIPKDLPLHQTICYRCTPSQKENIVRQVKEVSPFLTLAVGDGANDVNMITAADVGIGVKGKEGTQAARVADYVVGEFKHIRLLTLYYGREWYRKNCRLVCYNFFKNWYHVSCVIAYGAFTFFSGVVIFDIFLYEFFNVFFTALPIIIYAVFDEEYTHEESFEFTELYKPGVDNQQFNQAVYGKTIGQGMLYGLASILITFYLLETGALSRDGRTGYLKQSGSVLMFDIILVVNFKILNMCKGVRPVMLVAVFGSIMMYWVMYWIVITFVNKQMATSFGQEWGTAPILFIHFILVFFLVFVELAYNKYQEFMSKSKRKGKLDEMDRMIVELGMSMKDN